MNLATVVAARAATWAEVNPAIAAEVRPGALAVVSAFTSSVDNAATWAEPSPAIATEPSAVI